MMNGLKKTRGIDEPTKSSGTREQGMANTQLETAEVEKSSICSHRRIIHCALIV